MKPKTIYLYKTSGPFSDRKYVNCTCVGHDGPILYFMDQDGNRHITSVPWEVVQ